MRCPDCEEIIEPGMTKCPSCGASLPKIIACPGCGKELFETWNVCPYCGKKIRENNASDIAKRNEITKLDANALKEIAKQMKSELNPVACKYAKKVHNLFAQDTWACGRTYYESDRCRDEGMVTLSECTTWLLLNYSHLLPSIPEFTYGQFSTDMINKYGESYKFLVLMDKLNIIQIYNCEVIFFNF